MAIAARASGTSTLPSGLMTSASIAKPAGVQSGDIMLFCLYIENTGLSVTPPSGWTLIQSGTQSSAPAHSNRTYWKRDDGSAGPYSFTWGGSTEYAGGAISAYSGCRPAGDVIDASSINPSTSSVNLTGTTITTATASAMIVLAGTNNNGSPGTTPSGMTERYDVDEIRFDDVIQAAAGATGNKTATLSAAAPNIGCLLALIETKANAPMRRMFRMNGIYYR